MPNRPRKLSVIIPAYNEEASIAQIVERVRRADSAGLEQEIVLIDDGSRDRTAKVIKTIPGVKTLFHPRNRGKGAALKSGFAAATGDILLIQDADLEYDPGDYAVVLKPLLEGRADAVMGSRFTHQRPSFFFGKNRSPFFTHYIGNITITAVTNFLYGQSFTDYEGCYKAFTKQALEKMTFEADGFEFDNELVCRLLRRGARFCEVPVRYSPRSYEQGKKITWKDGVRMIVTILKWRLRPADVASS
jgi:glycosyltransferase involved in cell wall biosynthesis